MRAGPTCPRPCGRDRGRVVAIDPGRELTARIMGAHLSYVVVAQAEGTRLLLKVVARPSSWLAPAASLGDLVMARKQLLTLKGLAERDAGTAGG